MQSTRDTKTTSESNNEPVQDKTLTKKARSYLSHSMEEENISEICTLARTKNSIVTLGFWRKTKEIIVFKQAVDKNFSFPAIKNEYLLLGVTLTGSPHIVPFKGGYIGDEYSSYVATSFIANGSLKEILSSKKDLSWGTAIKLMEDVTHALAFMHSKNIVHRDIKSANILVENKDGKTSAYLADFGGARPYNIVGAYKSAQQTKMGTFGYRSPEAMNSIHYAASDIYSFGIVMWEIANRKLAYHEINQELDEIKWSETVAKRISENIPKGIANLILSCCKSTVIERPTEKDILESLDECKKTVDLEAKIKSRVSLSA